MASFDRGKITEDDSDREFDPLNPDTNEDEGWEDAEPEEEEQYQFTSLFDDSILSSLQAMIDYDKVNHSFDLTAVKKSLKLDFIGIVKLVNYIRTEVRKGNKTPDITSQEVFADEKYLRPVIDDDAVLFSLGDLGDVDETEDQILDPIAGGNAESRIQELELELRHAQSIIDQLRQVSLKRFEDGDDASVTSSSVEVNKKEAAVLENDKFYFKSYAYNDIHEIMLKDTVRTDAYRDFIYENKDLFTGKVVLDVGCGTGILSMMCAKAGAAKVYAVDNSDIIDKARANVFENKLSDTISCLRGKIEEIVLPVSQVDIIVSEWMGYALLYESMLDSVIFARDKYLKPTGLMVPSHTTLFIAPVAIPDIISDRVGFWDDVYGFRMPAMLEGIFDEVLLRNLSSNDIVGPPSPFLQLSLHTTKVQDTIFTMKPFDSQITKSTDPVDGFAIWFDMFFARGSDVQVPLHTQANQWSAGTAFTTGPGKATTHWQQVVLLFDRLKQPDIAVKMQEGKLTGSVSYERRKENERQLDITVSWTTASAGEQLQQKWELA